MTFGSQSVRCFAIGGSGGGGAAAAAATRTAPSRRLSIATITTTTTTTPLHHHHQRLSTALKEASSSSSSSMQDGSKSDSSSDRLKKGEAGKTEMNSNDEQQKQQDTEESPLDATTTSGIRGGGGGGAVAAAAAAVAKEEETVGIWPCFDDLDRRLVKISLPVIANFAINPLIGAVDLFWVNRMGNTLAVAGQAAANQVFNSVFWITSFLPSITATLIAKENKAGNKQGVQDSVCQALFVGMIFAAISSVLLLMHPEKTLSSVLSQGAPAMAYAKPYLLIRSLAFFPSLISLVGFSAFRGVLDTLTPVKISAFANIFNAVLDPVLIFTLAMGVPGAALATLAAEIMSAVVYLKLLHKRNMLQFAKLFKPPKLSQLEPLLRGGAALQLRNVSLNVAFLAVARVTQTIDQTGVAASAHALSIQTFQLGGIVLLALSTVAQTIIPNDMQKGYDPAVRKQVGGKHFAKATVNRLMCWGLILGTALGALQLALLPLITKSTPLLEVRQAARIPAILASVLQIINGMVFIGEGVMIGTGSFLQLSLSTVVATAGMLWALAAFPPRFGLTGVWIGFGVFNVLRLIGVMVHQLVNGPLAPKSLQKEKSGTAAAAITAP